MLQFSRILGKGMQELSILGSTWGIQRYNCVIREAASHGALPGQWVSVQTGMITSLLPSMWSMGGGCVQLAQ